MNVKSLNIIPIVRTKVHEFNKWIKKKIRMKNTVIVHVVDFNLSLNNNNYCLYEMKIINDEKNRVILKIK